MTLPPRFPWSRRHTEEEPTQPVLFLPRRRGEIRSLTSNASVNVYTYIVEYFFESKKICSSIDGKYWGTIAARAYNEVRVFVYIEMEIFFR